MRILQINSSDSSNGGASRIAMDLLNEANKLGHLSTMFSGTYKSNNQNVKQIHKTKTRSIISHLLANDISYFDTDYLLDTPEFKQADIVHAHNVHGWYFKLDTLRKMSEQKPLVWTLHDMWSMTAHCAHAYDNNCVDGFFTCSSRSDYPSLWWPNEKRLTSLKRKILERTNVHLVVPSQWLADKVKQSVLKNKPLSVIYNGIDTGTYTKIPRDLARSNLGLPQDKKIILFFASGGLANEFKGGDHVRNLAKQYESDSSLLFLCVGGETDQAYNNLIFRKGTNDKSKAVEFYSAADVFLFPSLAENFPLMILEALSCELPVVAFSVGGVPESVSHLKNGYLAEYKNIDDLKKGLDTILSLSSVSLETMRRFCRANVIENFSLQKMTSDYVNLYKTLT